MKPVRLALLASAFLLIGCTVNNTPAGSPGKFQLVPIGNQMFLLDNATGQIWTPGGNGWDEIGPMKPTTRPY